MTPPVSPLLGGTLRSPLGSQLPHHVRQRREKLSSYPLEITAPQSETVAAAPTPARSTKASAPSPKVGARAVPPAVAAEPFALALPGPGRCTAASARRCAPTAAITPRPRAAATARSPRPGSTVASAVPTPDAGSGVATPAVSGPNTPRVAGVAAAASPRPPTSWVKAHCGSVAGSVSLGPASERHDGGALLWRPLAESIARQALSDDELAVLTRFHIGAQEEEDALSTRLQEEQQKEAAACAALYPLRPSPRLLCLQQMERNSARARDYKLAMQLKAEVSQQEDEERSRHAAERMRRVARLMQDLKKKQRLAERQLANKLYQRLWQLIYDGKLPCVA